LPGKAMRFSVIAKAFIRLRCKTFTIMKLLALAPRVTVHDHSAAPFVGQVRLLVRLLRVTPSLCAFTPCFPGGKCTQ
jgi:hypothetical protein